MIDVNHYFRLSLASWIACIIMDGYLILNIFQAYQGSMRQLVQDFWTNTTVSRTAERFGLLVSFLSMANLGIDVYGNFSALTSDVSVHTYFIVCVLCNLGRVLVQGQWIIQ